MLYFTVVRSQPVGDNAMGKLLSVSLSKAESLKLPFVNPDCVELVRYDLPQGPAGSGRAVRPGSFSLVVPLSGRPPEKQINLDREEESGRKL